MSRAFRIPLLVVLALNGAVVAVDDAEVVPPGDSAPQGDEMDSVPRSAAAAAAEGVLNAARQLGPANAGDANTKGMPQLLALLTAGASAGSYRDDDGRVALHYAARRGRADATALLLEHHADVHALDANGN